MPRRSTSIVHICGESTDGKVHVVRSLLGKKIFEIFGGKNKLYCLSDIGIYDVLAAQNCNYENVGDALINDMLSLNISMGKKHTLVLSSSGQLYTWGEGSYGELGLGLKQFVADTFTLIPTSTTFKSITCGDYHSCAIDNKGNLFAWGQNFDCQLGLYTKDKSKMTSSSVVESVMFVPKYLPFSLKHPVDFVSCGSLFTAVVTQAGEIWTWGAGECGQLGTGKCTRRTLPQQCILETDIKGKSTRFISVACGVAHVLALTENGDIYSWGLNYKGQLGLGIGDTKSREFPSLINEITDATKIYAGDHSSALIDKNGKLYTWGSGSHGRLMQMETGFPEDHLCTPSLVYALDSEIVYSFCFSEFESAALVITRLLQVEPHSFPLRTNGQLLLKGCGFWDSDASIAKFSRVGTNALHAPRSTPASLNTDGYFSCKPPKLGDPGEYSISLAVNGEDFILDTVKIHVYAEPVLQSFSPNVLDIRTMLDQEVTMTLVGINLDGNGENANILIQFTVIDENGKVDTSNTNNITVPAKLLALPQNPEEDYDDNHLDGEDDLEDDLNSNASSDKNEAGVVEIERSLVCRVNLTNLWKKKKVAVAVVEVVPEIIIVNSLKDRSRRSSTVSVVPDYSNSINSNNGNNNLDDASQGNNKSYEEAKIEAVVVETSPEEKLESLYLPYCILQAQVTLNGYDFSRPASSQLLCHRFAAASVTPCCIAMSVGGRVEIQGTGFFPTSVMQVWAVLRLPDIDFSASGAMGYFLPCEYVSSNTLLLNIPPVSSLLGEDASDDIHSLNDHLTIELTFQGGGQSDGSASISLCDDCITMHYYSSRKILVKPRITRRNGGDRFVITQISGDQQPEGFPFKSDTAKVIFRTSASSFNPILLQLEAKMERFPSGSSASPSNLVVGDQGKDGQESEGQEEIDVDEDSQRLGYQIVCECPSLLPQESSGGNITAEEPTMPLPQQAAVKASSNSPAGTPSKIGTLSRGNPSRVSIQGMPRFVSVGIMLDGHTYPDDDHFTEVIIFDKVTPKDSQQIPKGGFPLGSNGQLNMEGLVQTDVCLVRIRGTNGNHVELPGTVSCNDRNGNGTVSFHLPSTMAGIDAEVKNGKQNFFFFDVSLDGGFSFDNAETAILQVKL